MKLFTTISVFVLVIAGGTLLITSQMIANGISDADVFQKVYIVEVLSGIFTLASEIGILIKVLWNLLRRKK